jgi:hypothetical protein
MNLGEVKKKALSLMAEYSIDGVEISVAENADYLNRMNRFANDAQYEIADKVGIDATYLYTQVGVSAEGFNKVSLPSDYKQIRFVNLDDYLFHNYRIENRKFIVKKVYDGDFEISYCKNPTELNDSSLDTYELEVDKHVQHLIPYYVGGMAIHDENPMVADRLLNIYYGKLSTITKRDIEYPVSINTTYTVF